MGGGFEGMRQTHGDNTPYAAIVELFFIINTENPPAFRFVFAESIGVSIT